MNKHVKLVEEESIKDTTLGIKDSEQNNTELNNISLPLNTKNNSNILTLIFRNQLSNDLTLSIDITKIITISDIINLLLLNLKISKSESVIRLFFKGRPLKNDEKIVDISK